MSANEPQSALELWKEKLADYQRQLAIAADPAVKFQLKKQIEECKQKIGFCRKKRESLCSII